MVTRINLKPRTFVLALVILLLILTVALILQAATGNHIAGWVAFVLGFIALLGRYWM